MIRNNYSRNHPSPRYLDLMGQYCVMHEEGEKFLGIPPEQTFSGTSLFSQATRIKRLIDLTDARSLIDYGCGKGLQYQSMPIQEPNGGVFPGIQAYWNIASLCCYDPCYGPFKKLPQGQFEGVVSTDVLEHCPEEDIPWILDEIFGYAKKFVFANVACIPAIKRLPSGENAHCTIRPPQWWEALIVEVAGRYPGILWEVWITHRTGDAMREDRIGNVPAP
jgi:hypothetical protein